MKNSTRFVTVACTVSLYSCIYRILNNARNNVVFNSMILPSTCIFPDIFIGSNLCLSDQEEVTT